MPISGSVTPLGYGGSTAPGSEVGDSASMTQAPVSQHTQPEQQQSDQNQQNAEGKKPR